MATIVKEATTKTPGDLTGSRMEITLITPGWASSGYYSPEVLEAAAAEMADDRRGEDGGVSEMGGLLPELRAVAAAYRASGRAARTRI